MGYFKREDETQESFYEEDGRRWFISGDIGEIFPDGTVKIIDRRKDLVKLQNGKFISLGKIESELKGSPLVENICIIADPNYKFCIALITPNAFFLNKLIKRHNLINEDKFNSEKIDKLVSEEIAKYAKKKQLQKAEIPERIKLCKEEWTPSNNLVTAAFKVRRKQIRDFYEDDIRKLYAE
ncbi:Long-chain-fatty-acid--CoA ligase 4 [Halotydeus destructor]|nr:Long-chain-fatty-acid--CoA ligase 4 [Halotydeus destructor]